MNLELASFPVQELRCGAETRWEDAALTIDPTTIRQLVLKDERIANVTVDVAQPGESARIIHVLDCVEPRTKVSGSGQVFPGIVGPMEVVGSGRTHRLAGVAVMSAAVVKGTRETLDIWESVVDMGGEGARLSPFSETRNVVLALDLAAGLAPLDCTTAAREAALRTAVEIAEATRGSAPSRVDTFDISSRSASLPNVAYICFLVSLNDVHTSLIYGRPITTMPSVVHPNEFADGAVVSSDYHLAALRNPTFFLQNNPVITELIKNHGRTLNFVGVVVAQSTISLYQDKQRSALQAAKLAKLAGADAAILTLESGGNAFTDLMLTCGYCERSGIQTVLITPEYAGPNGTEPSVVDFVAEAVAITSSGNMDAIVTMPEVKRVLGGTDFPPSPTGSEPTIDVEPSASFATALRRIQASTTGLGAWRISCDGC